MKGVDREAVTGDQMKKIAYMSLALVAMMAFGNAREALSQNEINGTMMVVKGDIKVTSAKTGSTISARVGNKVYPGDTIVSGVDSRAKIVMSDKNVLNISPDSKITIAKYENDPTKDSRNVELKVDYGKVRAGVEQKYDGEKNKFNIRTPTAVAGVRGTDFITGFNASTQQTRIVTFTGVVAAGQPGPKGEILNPVFVKPGMATNIDQGKPPEPPRPVPAEDLNKASMDVADAPSNAPTERAPAAATTSMVSGDDMDPKKNPVEAPDRGPASTAKQPIVVNQPPKVPVAPTPNPFLDNAIRNQKSRVNVKIVPM